MLGSIVSCLCRSSLWGSISFRFRVKGGSQSAELSGRAENLKNCSCCCHGSVLLLGGSSAFGFYMFSLCTGISLYFLKVDCFEWALIGNSEKCRVHLELWQFQRGGPSALVSVSLYILVFPYIF